MERRLADVVGAPVSVKAKRAEALGALGRREGVACFAVALADAPSEPVASAAVARPPRRPVRTGRSAGRRQPAADRDGSASAASRWRAARRCGSCCGPGGAGCTTWPSPRATTVRGRWPRSWTWPRRRRGRSPGRPGPAGRPGPDRRPPGRGGPGRSPSRSRPRTLAARPPDGPAAVPRGARRRHRPAQPGGGHAQRRVGRRHRPGHPPPPRRRADPGRPQGGGRGGRVPAGRHGVRAFPPPWRRWPRPACGRSALDAGAGQSLWDLQVADQPIALVLGAEGRGLGRLVRQRCDLVVGHPAAGTARVAQRGRGRHPGLLRGGPAAPGGRPRSRPARSSGPSVGQAEPRRPVGQAGPVGEASPSASRPPPGLVGRSPDRIASGVTSRVPQQGRLPSPAVTTAPEEATAPTRSPAVPLRAARRAPPASS